jgi:nucleotide-binding universal stress UspA family protein
MFHKILVAMDSSEISRYIFDEGVFLAQATGAFLILLHVLSPYEEGYPNMPIYPLLEQYSSTEEEMLQIYIQKWQAFKLEKLNELQKLAEEASNCGVKADFILNPGTPGYTICDLAQSWNADLIIVGRHGLSGVRELIMGSVSDYVTRHAHCAVLVLPHLYKEDGKISQVQQKELQQI